jgi:enoyl-CoA hydratase/3-hydroxyacyl-CoA dehydrogenase
MPQRPTAEYCKFNRFVLLDDVDGIKVITLRRPEALNALHDEMTDEILALVQRYENDQATAGFIITGYGTKAFCAGADIGKFPTMLGDRERAVEYARACSRLLVRLDRCSKPVVAAINGMALGGGLELAMRCHSLVAMDSAWMQFPEITLGIVPGIGAMVVPYRRWPAAATVFHGMLARAQKLSAQDALAAGIVDSLAADHHSLMAAALQRVRELAETRHQIRDGAVEIEAMSVGKPSAANGQVLSAEVLAIMSDAVRRAAQADSLSAALEIGYQAFGDSACTAAAKEGITAFAEKRKPDFSKTG